MSYASNRKVHKYILDFVPVGVLLGLLLGPLLSRVAGEHGLVLIVVVVLILVEVRLGHGDRCGVDFVAFSY